MPPTTLVPPPPVSGRRRLPVLQLVLAVVVCVAFWSLILYAIFGFAMAGAQVPDAAPTAAGLPGAALITKLLGWLRWGGLAGSLASVLVGAGVWGLSTTSGNGMYGTKGKTLLIGGLVGGALCGLAPALINAMYAG
jgi:hypothetical protein